jgi:hypothetical protein
MLAFMGPYFHALESLCPGGFYFGVLSVPHPRALSAQFHSGSKHALYSLPRSVSGGLRLSRTIGELRPLHWVVREEHLGFALSHLLQPWPRIYSRLLRLSTGRTVRNASVL